MCSRLLSSPGSAEDRKIWFSGFGVMVGSGSQGLVSVVVSGSQGLGSVVDCDILTHGLRLVYDP